MSKTPVNALVAAQPQLRDLTDRSRHGKTPELMADIHQFLRAHPAAAAQFGDPMTAMIEELARSLSDGNPLMHELAKHHAASLQSSLEGAKPSSVVRLLARQVAIDQLRFIQVANDASTVASRDARSAALAERRGESAHRQLIRSIRALNGAKGGRHG